ncbi:type I-E CRISPR-associated protein Cse1/CasA [Streptomyces buecherae]|uniref:type I-E CRISPR-associated protein Cse1/CasA n=1 Tax=Streptomyces buecherae TaxID=2763006 RepID=UPI0037AB54A9
MRPSFPLTTEAWIPLFDLDAGQPREVGLVEALTRAHRLSLSAGDAAGVPMLRFLAAAHDAAAGPTTTEEWDAAWRAETLDQDRITAYLNRWADRLDLFHPEHPALQCGHLTEPNRGPLALNPMALQGQYMSGAACLEPDHPAWAPAEAARHLLYHLAYGVAGIKTPAPGDPAARANKIYGSHTGTLGSCTHAHVELVGGTLKDALLLALPPQQRADEDAPVWERETPPTPMRTRAPAGRLDVLTWPSRRTRLFADDHGMVTGLAYHDGDRLPAEKGPSAVLHPLDPMTAWRTSTKGAPAPFNFTNTAGAPIPWAPAELLNPDPHSPLPEPSRAVRHAIDAAAYGVLDPKARLRVVLATAVYGTQQAVLTDTPVLSMPLGSAGQLATDAHRERLARAAALIKAQERVLGGNLADTMGATDRKHVGRFMAMATFELELEGHWHRFVNDPEGAWTSLTRAIDEAAERRLALTPGRDLIILAKYHRNNAAQHSLVTP